MLYNILPPTIFILSLGGIIVMVARVIVRLKREEFSADIKTFAAKAGEDKPGLTGTAINSAAEVLRPTQKSVHAIKSRVGLAKNMMQQTSGAIVSAWHSIDIKKMLLAKKPKQERPAIEEKVSGIKKPFKKKWFSFKRSKKVAIPEAPKTPAIEPSPAIAFTPSVASVAAPKVLPKAVSVAAKAKTKIKLVRQKLEQRQSAAEVKKEVAPSVQPKAVVQPEVTSGVRTAIARKLWPYASAVVAPAVKEAEAALSGDDYQKAEDILLQHIVEHTKDTDAYMLLGQIAVKQEAWDEALEIFEQIVKWNEHQPGVYTGLGLASYHVGRLTRALEALKRAHEEDPEEETILEHILSIAQKMDNRPLQHSTQEKIDELRQAQQKNISRERAGIKTY